MVTPVASPFSHVLLVGLGLIGGSFIQAARQAYPTLPITAVDINEASLQLALRQNMVDRAWRELPQPYLPHPDASPDCPELIVLASHLPVNQQYLQRLAPQVLNQPVVVTDLGSCKRQIVALGQALLPQQFLGGHPMAGRETTGLQQASSVLFAGKRFLMTPHCEVQQADLVERMSRFVVQLGMRPSVLSVENHDQFMAYVSHLPQLYAVLLTNLIAPHGAGRLLSFHGGGIDDQLRLAASPYAMWGPIFAENQDNLGAVVDEMIVRLQQLRQALGQPELQEWFTTSNQLHQAFHQLKTQAARAPSL